MLQRTLPHSPKALVLMVIAAVLLAVLLLLLNTAPVHAQSVYGV